MPRKIVTTSAVSAKPNLEFKIQQLRLDKIIYSLEAILVILVVFMALMFYPVLYQFLPNIPANLPLALLAIGVGFSFFVLIGNILRMFKIFKLEKELA